MSLLPSTILRLSDCWRNRSETGRFRGALLVFALTAGGAGWTSPGQAEVRVYQPPPVEIWYGGRRVDAHFAAPVAPQPAAADSLPLARRMMAEACMLAERGELARAITVAEWAASLPVSWGAEEVSPTAFLAELKRRYEGDATVLASHVVAAPSTGSHAFRDSGKSTTLFPRSQGRGSPVVNASAALSQEHSGVQHAFLPPSPAYAPSKSGPLTEPATPSPAGAGQVSVTTWLLTGMGAGALLGSCCLLALAITLRKRGATLGPLLRIEVVASPAKEGAPSRLLTPAFSRSETPGDFLSDAEDPSQPDLSTITTQRRTAVASVDEALPFALPEATFAETQRLQQEQVRQQEEAILAQLFDANLALQQQMRTQLSAPAAAPVLRRRRDAGASSIAASLNV